MAETRKSLCEQRDGLRKELAAIRKRILKVDEQAKRERAKEREREKKKRLREVLRRYGGKEAFISVHGQGKFIDEPRDEGYCSYSWTYEPHSDECALLGVRPNTERHWCSLRASTERDGEPVCGIHAKMIDRDRLCGKCWDKHWDKRLQSAETESEMETGRE